MMNIEIPSFWYFEWEISAAQINSIDPYQNYLMKNDYTKQEIDFQ